MPKSKAKSPARGRAKQSTAPAAKPRGTQHPANLKAILENRAKQPKLSDLRARKESAVALRAKLQAHDLNVVAQSSAKHARQLQKQITKVEADYQSRASKAASTRAAKAEAQQATLKALAGGRDELRAHARKLGISGRSQMSVPELRSAVAKSAAKSGARLGAGMMIAPIAAALVAYDSNKSRAEAAGISDKEATASAAKAALIAGGVTAAVGIGLSAAVAMVAKAGPKMVGRLVPYVGEGLMAAGAVEGAKKHGVAGAAFGALGADALLDLPMTPKQFADEVNPTSAYMSERLDVNFATANSAYHEMQVAKARSTLRGTQNPNNIAAIVANRAARAR